ncbi:hypothetical protein BFC23_14510 [Carnobacterium maltaromaticum]|jgi:hypothetical protein|nr:hypothetical protein BFC23_14510 [Carnobacterium maltaromaticum]
MNVPTFWCYLKGKERRYFDKINKFSFLNYTLKTLLNKGYEHFFAKKISFKLLFIVVFLVKNNTSRYLYLVYKKG